MNKMKLIILCGIGLFVVFTIWAFINAASKNKKTVDDAVTLQAEVPKEFSYEEMLAVKNGEKKNWRNPNDSDYSPQDNSPVVLDEETEEIRRIQSLITGESNEKPKNNVSVKEVSVKKKEMEDKPEDADPEPAPRSRFNSVKLTQDVKGNSIKAYVHGDQTVMDGSTLKMRLGEDSYTEDGILIPKNTLVYGNVKITGERVHVDIHSVKLDKNMHEFKREVFSGDAIKGIYIPGNIKSEASKEAVGDGLNRVNVGTPLSGNVATDLIGSSVGSMVNATKTVASKNVKKTKVTIKTNYEIYLK